MLRPLTSTGRWMLSWMNWQNRFWCCWLCYFIGFIFACSGAACGPWAQAPRECKNKANEVNGKYEKAVLNAHKKLSESQENLSKIRAEIKIIRIKDSYNPERTLQTEKDKIRKRINSVTKEVLNYENNLGFFSPSKGDNPLLKNVTSNIEKGKREIEKLKKELKKLSIQWKMLF